MHQLSFFRVVVRLVDIVRRQNGSVISVVRLNQNNRTVVIRVENVVRNGRTVNHALQNVYITIGVAAVAVLVGVPGGACPSGVAVFGGIRHVETSNSYLCFIGYFKLLR